VTIDKQKKRTAVVLAIVCCFLMGCAIIWLIFSSSLSDGWPQVPSPNLFVTSQPKFECIPGNYHLIRQTITTNGLATFNGRQCEIELRSDGSFVATNYPKWFQTNSVQPPTPQFIFATGHWHCETMGIVRSREFYGIVFSESPNQIDSLALRSDGSPYNLMMTYGDADEGLFMIFGKH
jgi:hypothetical protein